MYIENCLYHKYLIQWTNKVLEKIPNAQKSTNSFQVKYIYYFQQGMGILHCAAQNNHVEVMNFIFESLENMNINEGEMVNYSDNLKKIKSFFL